MDCYNCESKLIWGGDEMEDNNLVSNFSCPNCFAYVIFYHPVII